jgi:hypothetical protein
LVRPCSLRAARPLPAKQAAHVAKRPLQQRALSCGLRQDIVQQLAVLLLPAQLEEEVQPAAGRCSGPARS